MTLWTGLFPKLCLKDTSPRGHRTSRCPRPSGPLPDSGTLGLRVGPVLFVTPVTRGKCNPLSVAHVVSESHHGRSRGPTCQQFGGGGHSFASEVSYSDLTLEGRVAPRLRPDLGFRTLRFDSSKGRRCRRRVIKDYTL